MSDVLRHAVGRCCVTLGVLAVSCQEPASEPAPREVLGGLAQATGSLDRDAYVGRSLYRRYCRSCHGETGAGDGLAAASLPERPPDLGRALRVLSDAALQARLAGGGRAKGSEPPVCPPYGANLGPERQRQVLRFLRALGQKAPP